MSVTATQNPVYYTLAEHLREYDIHHSGDSGDSGHDTPSSLPNVTNPARWPTDHRRVPAYRPVVANVEVLRNGTRNTAEAVFVLVMLSGCWFVAGLAKGWGASAGPYFPKLFEYKVGGEY